MTASIVFPGDFSQFVRACGEPLCPALMKQECEDFQVDEELGFEPVGVGDHLFLRVRKRDLGTADAADRLAREIGAEPGVVGFSGMKDRRAVTSQWFSVPAKLGRGLKAGVSLGAGLELLEVRSNDRKLRLGSHRANHFRIRLRQLSVDPGELAARLDRISTAGVPNYFGPQRLGRQMSNVCQAQDYFRGFDDIKGMPRLPRKKKSMLLSATRSFLFNGILSRRVTEASWNRMLPGEVFNLAGTKRLFKAKPTDDVGVLESRLGELDIHPTGLLAGEADGKDPYLACDAVAALEADCLADFPELSAGLVRAGVQSSRRALRLVPKDLRAEFEDAETLVLSFTLGPGGYATALLRELVLV
jgi:tRNA pseudouridine13 synthase